MWLAMISLSPLILDLAKSNTDSSSPFFQAWSPLIVLSVCFSLAPGLVNDRGPRGSDHHMGHNGKTCSRQEGF